MMASTVERVAFVLIRPAGVPGCVMVAPKEGFRWPGKDKLYLVNEALKGAPGLKYDRNATTWVPQKVQTTLR